jgi:hypothetical protein
LERSPGFARTVKTERPDGNFASDPLRSRFLEYDRIAKQITVTGLSRRSSSA